MVDFVPLFELNVEESIASQLTVETTADNQLDFFIEADANTEFTLELNTNPDFSVDMEIDLFTVDIGPHTANNINPNVVSSATLDVIVTAAISLSLYRAVTGDGLYCEPTQPSLERYAGVTKVAVSPGNDVSLIRVGKLTDNMWSWTPDAPIFVGASGVLTQVSASSPVRRIGWAMSATQINFDPFPTIGA